MIPTGFSHQTLSERTLYTCYVRIRKTLKSSLKWTWKINSTQNGLMISESLTVECIMFSFLFIMIMTFARMKSGLEWLWAYLWCVYVSCYCDASRNNRSNYTWHLTHAKPKQSSESRTHLKAQLIELNEVLSEMRVFVLKIWFRSNTLKTRLRPLVRGI